MVTNLVTEKNGKRPAERLMLEAFKTFCEQETCEGIIKIHGIFGHSTREMDFEADLLVDGIKYLFRCEAKVATHLSDGTQTKDGPNAVHKLFGLILSGRAVAGHKKKADSPDSVVYGLMIPSRDFGYFKRRYLQILDDWNKFGAAFDARFVLVFDESQKELRVFGWNDAWVDSQVPMMVLV